MSTHSTQQNTTLQPLLHFAQVIDEAKCILVMCVCNFGEWYGVPPVVHYWADLQSAYGFHCYDNIAPNTECQRVLVVTLCLDGI